MKFMPIVFRDSAIVANKAEIGYRRKKSDIRYAFFIRSKNNIPDKIVNLANDFCFILFLGNEIYLHFIVKLKIAKVSLSL